ncbi:hypothetical protein BH23PLA1_BH23PLA1_24140 [soil metagenome]
MMRPVARTGLRSGITLTEILISIMIMGIGLVSVASLFPIGMMRIREAVNDSRSTLTAGSALGDIHTRNLLDAQSFRRTWYPARAIPPFIANLYGRDPGPLAWDYDTQFDNEDAVLALPNNPGLPFAYDPLFWSTLHFNSANDATPMRPDTQQARFGSGIGLIRNDPDDGQDSSAYGLQRLTNFVPHRATLPGNSPGNIWLGLPFTYSLSNNEPAGAEVAGDIFSSLDDPVVQADGPLSSPEEGIGSPLVPQNFNFVPNNPNSFESLRDYRFTWMLTGRAVSARDTSTFVGEIVLFHNRPIGLDPQTVPGVGTVNVPTGERVVEAVWGHTGSVNGLTGNPGYSNGDDRLVLLRWPTSSNDPNVPVGSWIADVTYAPTQTLTRDRYGNTLYPGQRIHWYRVVQRSTPEPDPAIGGHRRMTVRIDRPVQAKTLLRVDGNDQVVPVHNETALINNYVINVFPQVFYSR